MQVSDVTLFLEAQMLQHKAYTHSSKTNVLETFKRQGWVPPSEQAEFQDKWKYYRSLPLQEPEQCEEH
jgi:hypothetical protein